jgi:hypothetical protein
MNSDQAMMWDTVRGATLSGNSGLLSAGILGAIFLATGILAGSWVLTVASLVVLVPTVVAVIRRRRNRKMWAAPRR